MSANRAQLAMGGQRDAIGQRLMRFLPYLRLLARMQIEARFQPHLDGSWVAQQTVVEAFEHWEQFRGGDNDAQLAGWLRKMLTHNLADAVHAITAKKRDIGRERSLYEDVEQSSIRLENWLQDGELSPSEQAIKNDRLLHLANALEKLGEAQRQAVEWHHLQGMKLAEIAQRMGKSPAAVAGLLHRGLKQLRALMEEG